MNNYLPAPARRDLVQAGVARLVPVLIVDPGEAAGWRYVEFLPSNIRNPKTRRAYARACARLFAWCENRRIGRVSPHCGFPKSLVDFTFERVTWTPHIAPNQKNLIIDISKNA
ncbi:MAG: hypothetical protein HIU92_20235 [Proteobacteria bacterium]|nr:hypothetical protein [Pseudomonadota bacterium]